MQLSFTVLQDEVQMPVTFTRGFVKTLRLRIPWKKLGSEPVVINVDTMEVQFTTRKDTGPAVPSSPTSAAVENNNDVTEGWGADLYKK